MIACVAWRQTTKSEVWCSNLSILKVKNKKLRYQGLKLGLGSGGVNMRPRQGRVRFRNEGDRWCAYDSFVRSFSPPPHPPPPPQKKSEKKCFEKLT